MNDFGCIGIVTGSAEARALLRLVPGARALPPSDVTAGALRDFGIARLVSAAHPFDKAAHAQAARAAREAGAELLILCRPGYSHKRGDRWYRAPDIRRALDYIAAGSRVFVTTGGEDHAALRRLDARYFLRRRAAVPGRCMLRGATYVSGEGPFTVTGEMRLMRTLGIDWLVARDAGGLGSAPKIEAARRLGLPVALINRPALPKCRRARTPEEALEWLMTDVS